MSVLTRSDLESSPLADLHAIASELGLDGYRRLRKADLVAAILEHQGGDDTPAAEGTTDAAEAADANGGAATDEREAPKPRRSRRGGRGRSRVRDRDDDQEEGTTDEDAGASERPAASSERPPRRSRSRDRDRERSGDRDRDRGDRDRDRGDRERDDRGHGEDRGRREDVVATGTVELLPNGSGFLRVKPPESSDDDVYISAAQVRRCELVSGDEVAGPVRAPRRSERFPSLIRIDIINNRAAEEVAEGTKFEDLPAAYATERFALGGDDPTLQAIEWLTPIGCGSRAVIVGAPRAGRTETLRRLAGALAGQEGLDVSVVLAGVRPEEIGDWAAGPVVPNTVLSLGASGDAQGQAVERGVEVAKRLAARGGNAVVLIDSLEQVPAPAARRVLAAARNIVDGGSLTVIATAREPFGGETAVIALDAALASTGRFPALDLVASATVRAELLVGEKGAEAIAEARAQAMGA